MDEHKPNRRGPRSRRPRPDGYSVVFRASADLVSRVDAVAEYEAKLKGGPMSRADVIRTLVVEALAARAARKGI